MLLTLPIFPSSAQNQDSRRIDSLISLYHQPGISDAERMDYCYKIANLHDNPDSTILWADRLLALSDMENNPRYKCEALGFLSWAYYYTDNSIEATKINTQGYILADSLGDIPGKAYHLYMLGYDYYNIKDHRQSDIAFQQALEIYTALGDSLHMSRCLRGIASNYEAQRTYKLAYEALDRALEIDSVIRDSSETITTIIAIAEMNIRHYEENVLKKDIATIHKAKEFTCKAMNMNVLEWQTKIKTRINMVRILHHEVGYYRYMGPRRGMLLDSMRRCCLEIYQILDHMGDLNPDYKHSADLGMALFHVNSRNLERGKTMLDSIRPLLNEKSEHKEMLYIGYITYYAMSEDYIGALNAGQEYSQYLLDKTSVDFAVFAAQKLAQAEIDRQKEENDKNMNEHKFRMRIIWIIGIFILILFLTIFLHERKHVRNLNKINKNITDSINYASLIQNAAMPNSTTLSSIWDDYCLFFRPLKIVAGDFFWTTHIGRLKIIVCADCTGHGVPGAFLSILGISLLNEITSNISSQTPAALLNVMRTKLMKSLKQKESILQGDNGNTDGIDLAMAIIDTDNMKLQYAGANRPLWLWRNGEIKKFSPDHIPIGTYLGDYRSFQNHEIDIQKGDMVYMFSDGITDQFGKLGCNDSEKYSSRRLSELLTRIGSMDGLAQKSEVETALDTWRNGFDQVDDMILIGVRV